MALIADGLMIVASLVAAIYCVVLSNRVRGLTNLDQGLGAAIAGLSRQVDGMQAALEQAKRASGASTRDLREMTARAEAAAKRLETLIASLHEEDLDAPRPVGPEILAAAARAAQASSEPPAPPAPEPESAAASLPEFEPEPAPEPEFAAEAPPEADPEVAPQAPAESPVAQDRGAEADLAGQEEGDVALAPPPGPAGAPASPAAESLRNALRDLLGRKES